MIRKFYKMHGIGNDYIYFDCLKEPLENPSESAVRLSDRHFGIGGDGIVLICPSETCDAKMRMFNADGSEGNMCGNAIRCVGKFLHDVKGIDKTRLTIETKSGVKILGLILKDGAVESVEVDMGAPVLEPERIPVLLDSAIAQKVQIAGGEYTVTCVSMGNPHCVVFGGDPYLIDLEAIGSKFENDPLFPDRTNTEFAEVIKKNELKMRVWERGSGETWACGTGACAVAVAAVLNGFAEKDAEITVHLRGGDLKIRYTDETVKMTGTATLVFTGETEI